LANSNQAPGTKHQALTIRLGLIAGNGRFPFLVLDAAHAQGHDVTIIAAKEETFPELNEAAARHRSPIHWISLGQLGTCITLLKEAGVTHAVMAGQVKHTKIFAGGVVPDRAFLGVLKQLASKNTDGLIGAVASVLRDRGIELMDSTALLQPLLASPGVLTRRAPTDEEQKDFEFGYRMADAIAGLDVGQTIAVKDQAVVAVEAMEGTDEVIARARISGADAAILATSGAGGHLVALNRAPVLGSGFPTVLVPGSALPMLRQAAVHLDLDARLEPSASATVIGHLGPGDATNPVVVATPLSGWFHCAGERG
jgi:hypothetical protein